MKSINTKTYIVTLFFTLCLFFGALYISNFINREKTAELQSGEDKLAVDIMQVDNELSTLKTKTCSTITTTNLQTELDSLSSRLSFMEQQVGDQDPEIYRLKRYDALLQSRGYLLTKKANDECNKKAVYILYFYPNKTCSSCATQQYILQAVKDEYSNVYVYSFDYDLDLTSVQSLVSLPTLPKNPPILDINGKLYASFNSLNDIESIINPLLATSTATSTSKK